MLPKINRVDTKTVEKVFKVGKFLNSPLLTFKFIQNKDILPPKVSFTAPKSVAKKAVERNLLRRIGYKTIAKYMQNLPQGLKGVFVFRKNIFKEADLDKEIKDILNKI